MDPRERADATLARARARGAFVVTPESAVSPMDAAATLQLPRIVIAANDERRADDPDATVVVPRADVQGARTEENIPAIAQESFTDVVGSPPGIRSRQRRIEDARARSLAARRPEPAPTARDMSEPPAPRPAPQATPHPGEPEQVDGLIPTTKQPPTATGSLSQRLDG